MIFLFASSGQFSRMAPGEWRRAIPRDRFDPESDSGSGATRRVLTLLMTADTPRVGRDMGSKVQIQPAGFGETAFG